MKCETGGPGNKLYFFLSICRAVVAGSSSTQTLTHQKDTNLHSHRTTNTLTDAGYRYSYTEHMHLTVNGLMKCPWLIAAVYLANRIGITIRIQIRTRSQDQGPAAGPSPETENSNRISISIRVRIRPSAALSRGIMSLQLLVLSFLSCPSQSPIWSADE